MVPAPDQWVGEVLKDPGISCMFGVHGGYACKVIWDTIENLYDGRCPVIWDSFTGSNVL